MGKAHCFTVYNVYLFPIRLFFWNSGVLLLWNNLSIMVLKMKNWIKKLVPNLSLLLIVGLLFGIVVPLTTFQPTYAQSDTLYENFITDDDAVINITGNNWFGQTFTTNTTIPHTITQIKAKIYRVGSPGTLTANIYQVSGGVPTGQEIGTGDISGDALTTDTAGAWYSITLDEEIALQTGTIYAVVLEARNGTSEDYVLWRYDNADGYADGTEVTSTNGGSTWSAVGANDMMFEIWGNPAINILDAKVFESFLEDDDQLFVFSYQVFPPTEYDDKLPQNYFNTQLLTDSTLKAQGKLPAWGYKPGSIYLSASSAVPWGTNTTSIKIAGIAGTDFAGNIGQYTFTGSDWEGEDLDLLDDWVITNALAMGTWYDVDFITASQGGENLLTYEGGVVFMVGIPGLVTVRDNLFTITPTTELPEKKTHTDSYAEGLLGGWGSGWTRAVDDIGTLIGVSGDFVGGSIWGYVVILGISVIGVGTGSPVIGLVCAGLPLLFMGGLLGTIPLVYILLPVFILGTWAILKLTIWKV